MAKRWDRITFWANWLIQFLDRLKTVAFFGTIFWVLVILTLQFTGIVDVETQCSNKCMKIIELIVRPANAFDLAEAQRIIHPDGAPIKVKVTLLP